MKKTRGSALVEFCLGASLFGVFLSGFLRMERFVERERAAWTASEIGAALQGYADVDVARVQQTVAVVLGEAGFSPSEWTMEVGRFTDVPAAGFYRLVHARVVTVSPFSWDESPRPHLTVVQQEEATP